MTSLGTGWDNFWGNQKLSFHKIMRLNTIFFASRLETLFPLKPTHQILDYGAGPGFLADYLAEKSIQVTNADINKFFVHQSKSKNKKTTCIQITTDPAINRKIFEDQFKDDRFDFIILLSVVQYFKNKEELERVINMLSLFLKENGKIVLADILSPKTSSLRDAISLFFHCIKKGKVISYCRFILYLIFSNYRKHRMFSSLLRLSEQSIQDIAHRQKLTCLKVDHLTIHESRTNYVLTKAQCNIREHRLSQK